MCALCFNAYSCTTNNLSLADGYLGIATFGEMLSNLKTTRKMKSNHSLDGPITGLHLTRRHSNESCIVGACEDGSFGIWDLAYVLLRMIPLRPARFTW